ncbi:MAG TPA: VWA domain-containing protein [Thermoanaerobaculia bacterium]|jgi:VWFA-related protein|nr:VWA domain-containing protein [Thermoanaerobaculia bacterium]
MKRFISWTILAGLSFALPSTAAKPKIEIPVIGETIDVRVVNVEAVVTATSGRRVPGLSAADFRLLVDGKEVPVEYFAEISEGKSVQAEKAPVAAGEEVGRNYLIYVDDAFSLANRRNAILEKLERDLTLLGPADRMAILAFDGARVSVLCGWTGDRKTLQQALGNARQRPALGGEMLAHQRKLQADVDWIMDNADSIETGDSDRVGGPKVSELDEIFKATSKRVSGEARTQLGKTTDAATAAIRGFETPPGRKVMLMLSGAWSLSVAARLYSPVVQAANQLGYTVYPVDASQSDAYEATALDTLARATGGRLLIPADNAVFREAVADSGTYYWLGFTPAWKADDRGHHVTVEVRKPGLAVRSRSGFSDLSHRTEAAMKAESVLLFGGASDDHRLIVELGEPKRDGGAFEVPVTLGVPVEALSLTPKGKGYLAVVPLAVSTEEADGRRANLSGPQLKVQIAALPQAGTYARFQTVVRLRDPKQRLIFSVHDPVSGHALWGQAQVVPGK